VKKPEEIYDIIERFCLGRKRIELFGRNNNIRNGWLTIGSEITEDSFRK
jgi:mRNA m6A methyltransferase non-catalytic subunit